MTTSKRRKPLRRLLCWLIPMPLVAACQNQTQQDATAALSGAMTVPAAYLQTLNYNIGDDYVLLHCQRLPEPIRGDYTTTATTINYMFNVDTKSIEGDTCYIDHHGEPLDFPKSWYDWRLNEPKGIVRASTAGKVTRGELKVDFYRTIAWHPPKRIDIVITTIVLFRERRGPVRFTKATLDCPQKDPRLASQIEVATDFNAEITDRVHKITYNTHFVTQTQRQRLCSQTLETADGQIYKSLFYFRMNLGEEYYFGTSLMMPDAPDFVVTATEE